MPPVPLRFVKSAQRVDDLPPTEREVAVVGRSNVGKSSLINAVANRNRLAHVSKTPGRTQLINLFEVAPGATVVDLPGYGYAKVPGRIKQEWGPMIEGYLLGREALQMVMVLVDGEIGPTKLDVQMLEWLRANEIPHQVIATKSDKVKSAKKPTRKKELAAACQLEPGDVLWVSAEKNVSIDRLQDMVRSWLGGVGSRKQLS
jgi:GTP-binding protein